MRGGRAAAAVLLAWALLGLLAPGAAETGGPPREQHRAATTAAPVPAVSAAAVEPAQTPETAQAPVPGETTVPSVPSMPGETTVPGETAGEPVPCHGGPSRGHVGVRAPRAAGGPENGRGTGCAPAPVRAARPAVAGPRPAGVAADGPGACRVPGDVTRLQTFRC
ncbi:hypothetical protein [Streptomyces olivaceus]|uniref:hypothetical protein n=1 Tax=Streptomyces olivaceus TaxID=47716 RepID=UPI001CCCD357|nr:hypothetical protein [Streptomyces olivaceus]MBZ6287311.1 hypothetical protein [Streptomyces olivaceus]